MNKIKEHIINSEEIYRGKLLTLEVNTVELPNKSYSKREIIKHDGSAAVIALNDENELILVKQYRAAVGTEVIEIPAGKLESGEDPIDTAIRELSEETGFSAKKMEHLLDFYPSPGYSKEIIHLFIANNLSKAQQNLDTNEYIEVINIPVTECIEMIESGQIIDSKTIIAIQYLYMNMVHDEY